MSIFEWNRRGEEANEAPPVHMPEMIWQVLYGRGVRDGRQVTDHFSPKLTSLKDPHSLKNMDRVVERLVRAYRTREKICIYADFDLDGTSGLALLYSAMCDLGFEGMMHYQPKRLSEGYGVHPPAIEAIAAQGASVIVTIDVGITDLKAAVKAKELGVDFIVTDHHQPKEELPEAFAIVNPNCRECDSSLGYLSGAGVAFFLLLALRRALGEEDLLVEGFDPKDYLDCFVIGTLTDLVPIVRENRVLCKHGLVRLAKTCRPGLKYLLKELGLWGKPISSQDVAIRFAPKLNALSRMEIGIMPIDLFLESDPERARELVSQVVECNEMRRALQKEAEEKALSMYQESPTDGFVFVYSESFHKGVVGLVATKLSQKLGVPAFVGYVDPQGKIVGSGRAPKEGESLLDALAASGEVLTRFGGHNAAAGFELPLAQAERFRQRLAEHYHQETIEEFCPVFHYDAEGRIPQLNPQFMKWYDHLGPFGTEFDAPVFRFSSLQVVSCRGLRGGHIKLKVRQAGFFQEMEALWFSPPKEHPLANEEKLEGQYIDVLAEPSWNDFAGRRTLQMIVKDLRLAVKSR